MKGILALCVLDFRRLLTNALFWVISSTLIIIVGVVNFALPENASGDGYSVVSYNLSDAGSYSTVVDSEAELIRMVKEEDAVGLLGSEGSVTVVHSGLSAKNVRAIMLSLDTEKTYPGIKVESIYENGQTIPFNLRMAPIFICFEAIVIGFILGGALLLSEKEDGTARALRISPMGVDRYLLAKTLLFSVIGTLYAWLIAVLCVGMHFSQISFLLLSFFGSALFSLIGLAFSSVFKDMGSWFFSMALVLSINMLPAISYTSASFSPAWMQAIPSYLIIFAYERILFGTAGNNLPVVLSVTCWCIGSYLVSRSLLSKYLLGGGQRA